MSNKRKNKEIEDINETEKALAEAEEAKHIVLQTRYDEYNARMQNRQGAGEKVTVKAFEQWVRKAKNPDGSDTVLPGDTGETKNEKFRRLAVKRTEKALRALHGVMALSSVVYESTPEEQTKIVNALRLAIMDIETSFKVVEKKESLFDFDES